MPSADSPLILTLKLDSIAFDRLNELRQQHFPAERNFLPAHVTLFHKLPADQETILCQTLQDLRSHQALPLRFPQLRFLGKGVAIEVDSPTLINLRRQLAQRWAIWLSTQDQQGYRPHVTIQNKVAPEIARPLFDRLSREWQAFEGSGEGLLLWRYQGGPWQKIEEFTFELPNLRA